MARLGWFGIIMPMGVIILMFCGENMMVKGRWHGLPREHAGAVNTMRMCTCTCKRGRPWRIHQKHVAEKVRTVDIPCVCQRLSKEIEQIVDMDKVFHLASFCGRPLAHGTKCGSKYYLITS